MDFNSYIIEIKKLYRLVHGKDEEVVLTYKGTSYGVTTPWNLRCEKREVNGATHEKAASMLYLLLKDEFSKKVDFAEKEAIELKKIYASLAN